MHLPRTVYPLVWLLSIIFSGSLALPFNPPSPSVSVQSIWDFTPGTWVENLAVRSNGQILVTLLSAPEVYQVDPTQHAAATLVHRFDSALGCLGIAELGADTFYVATGGFTTATLAAAPGTFAVWKLDMTGCGSVGGASGCATATKMADFPGSGLLNGVTAVDPTGRTSKILLVADSGVGVVWSLDVATGLVAKAVDDPLLVGTPGSLPLGVNGVKVVHGKTLYFTNTNKALLAEAPIDRATGRATAPAKAVIATLPGPDDFLVDGHGKFLIAGSDELRYALAAKGESVNVASSSPLLVGSTAVQLGRTECDRGSAYVSTSGGTGQYISHQYKNPGRVVKVSLGL